MPMSPFQMSCIAWAAGGVAGAAMSKRHPVTGCVLGALFVGAIADVVIERHHPLYAGIPARFRR